MALDRARASQILDLVKTKGNDAVRATSELIYSAEAQLKGSSLQELVNRGKLAALNAIGDFETTNASPVFQHRMRGLIHTRAILEKIDKEFSHLVSETAALGLRFDKLCGLLNQFRMCCDTHITLSVEEEERVAKKELEEGGFVELLPDRDPTIGENKDASEEDLRIQAFQAKMKRMIAELRETVDLNCGGICRAAITNIDAAHHSVVQDVKHAQTNLDMQRRKVQGAKEMLQKIRADVNMMPDGHTSKGLRVMQLEQCQAGLCAKVDDENALRVVYDGAVKNGMSQLHYALEQSSMSTWSVYNIFFSQMTHFFDEAAGEAKQIAKTFASLKNMQSVSKRISEEKRQMLHDQQQLRTATPPPPPVSATTAGLAATAPPAISSRSNDHRDDDFESFVTQRQESVVRAGGEHRPASDTTTHRQGPATPQQETMWKDLFDD